MNSEGSVERSGRCRLCGAIGEQFHRFTLPNQPPSAQGFYDNEAEARVSITLSLFECGSCGVVYHNSSPVPYYKDVVRAASYSPEMMQFRERQFIDILTQYSLSNENILEIGAGTGDYVNVLKRCGAQKVHAIEHSQKNITHGEFSGVDVRKDFIEDMPVNPWAYDFMAIFCFNFIEHWPNLRTALENIRRFLQPGGYVFFEVPNFDMILKNGLFAEFTTDHIFYFRESVLQSLMTKMGFRCVKTCTSWNEYITTCHFVKNENLNFDEINKKYNSKIIKIKSILSQYTGDCVVWGAGHQALSLLASCDAREHIKYVVDSAAFKQGKYCPVTGIPIVAPERLYSDPPSCVIAAAGSYNHEVIRTLKARHANIRQLLDLNEL